MLNNKLLFTLIFLFSAAGAAAGDSNLSGNLPVPSPETLAAVQVPAAPPPPAAGALADYPVIKSRALTFNSGFYVRAAEGKVWIKPNYERTGKDGAWEILAVPQEAGSIKEVSADGDNLMAVSAAGRVFYMKFSTRKWAVKIGKPFSRELYLPENRAWAVSHLGPEVGGYYNDPDGKPISNRAGVSTLYALAPDGSEISYIDPWLPAVFNHHVTMPLRGRFVARSLSASASTLFIIGGSGRMFTRLADFDTLGCDPLLSYSFEPSSKTGRIRLPAEDWREQPRIDGRVTAAITILQNGRGNAARELRVEGADAAGNAGYYSKSIYGAEWKFVKTGGLAAGPFLDGADELSPSLEKDIAVNYSRLPEGSALKGFSARNGEAVLLVPGFENTPLKFYTREVVLPAKAGEPGKFYGTIGLPDALLSSSDAAARRLVKKLGGSKFREVHVKVLDGSVELRDSHLRIIGHALQVSRISQAMDDYYSSKPE